MHLRCVSIVNANAMQTHERIPSLILWFLVIMDDTCAHRVNGGTEKVLPRLHADEVL